jgi:hypothetical protein
MYWYILEEGISSPEVAQNKAHTQAGPIARAAERKPSVSELIGSNSSAAHALGWYMGSQLGSVRIH